MDETAQSLLRVGGKFGAYDVVRELGRGGMGAVYLLRDPSNGAEMAAKVMFPALRGSSEEQQVRRFVREAEIAMTVDHPNLVKVYDVGRDPDTGLGYMLMDYLPGGSLQDRLVQRLMEGRGPFTVAEALSVVRQVAEALDAAAAHGVVHRDVKPDNILFAADGTVCLTDLGVARRTNMDSHTSTLTMANMVVGTPAYMAPEQMTNSHGVDVRADIYSLGIVLWELLAGERPTAGLSPSELMARAVRAERIPDIRTRRKRTPAGVAELLRRMTDPSPTRRFATPGEVVRFIDDWRAWERRRLRRWLVGTVAVGILLVLGVLAGGLWYVHAVVLRKPPSERAAEESDSPVDVTDAFAAPDDQ